MNENTSSERHNRLMVLRKEHRNLDETLAELLKAGTTDQLEISRMKRRKLQIKDEIIRLEALILPDIIA